MQYAMKIHGFTLDSLARRPVVILKDETESVTLPLWINSSEAVTIAVELISRDIAAKSGGNDLLVALLNKMGFAFTGVAIDLNAAGVYCAEMIANGEGGEMRMDVKLYEALILALKYDLPVIVDELVTERTSLDALSDGTIAEEHDARRFADYLEGLNPEEMGKYPM